MSLGICPPRILCAFAATLLTAASLGSASAADPLVPGAPEELSPDIRLVAAAITDDASDPLGLQVDEAIKITSRRFLTANVHTPWQILHGILALRQDFQIKLEGKKTSALKWLSEGNEWKDESIVVKTPYGGEFHRFTKPYHFQGHPNQFLAILTMSELGTDFEMLTAKGETITIEQMLNNARMTVNDREEITWTLWALARYLPIDSEWINKDGEAWSMERLVQIQTYADLSHAACGGTHGLFALSLARNSYIYSGKKPRGIWLEADQKIKRYITEARSLQNSDGTFSSNYFSGPGKSEDFGKRIATSGHILEFLMVAVDDKELEKPWLRKAVGAVANELTENRRKAADCGPLYHALHALVLYRQRTGGRKEVEAEEQPKATQPEASTPETPVKPEATPAKTEPESDGTAGNSPTVETTEETPNSETAREETATLESSEKLNDETPGEESVEEESASSSEELKPQVKEDSTDPADVDEFVFPLFGGPLPAEPSAEEKLPTDEPAEPASETIDPFAEEPVQSDSQAATDSTPEEAVTPASAEAEEPSEVLEENALNSMGMSGEKPDTVDVPLPPTSD